jgi:predicted  nucleic acid-binding Zn-ribbon protein
MAFTVADQVRQMREGIIADRVAVAKIRTVLPESSKQAASRAIAAQAIYAGGLSQRSNDVSVNAMAMQAPRASMLGALQREMAKPCPTGYVRDGRGECVVVIETGTPQNAIPYEYRGGPTLSQFRPILDLNAAVPGRSTTVTLQTLKRNLGRLSVGLNGLSAASNRAASRAYKSGLNGLGLTLTTGGTVTGGTISTGPISTTLTTQQIIDGLNAQITSLNSQVTNLQSQYASLDAACQKSTTDLSTCNATLANTKAALDAANAQIATLTSQVNALTSQLTAANSSVTTLQQTVATRDATIAAINATLADIKSQLAAAQAQVTDLKNQLAASNTSMTAANAQAASLQSQVASLQSQLAAVTADRNNLASAAQTATAQLASANSAIAALKAVCSALSSTASAQATTLKGLGVMTMDAKVGNGEYGDVKHGMLGGLGGPVLVGPDYPAMYANCVKLAQQIKADLDAKAGFIDPATCPKTECPSCPGSDLPPTAQKAANWLPLVVAGVSAVKLFS